MPAIARQGDTIAGTCQVGLSTISVSGVISTGLSSTTFADGKAIAVQGSGGDGGCTFTINPTGAKTKADGIPVARLGDAVTITSPGPGSGTITSGSPTTFAE
jgi:uncharacterized Zn-binding protein involved in type VI secretion